MFLNLERYRPLKWYGFLLRLDKLGNLLRQELDQLVSFGWRTLEESLYNYDNPS